MTTQLDARSFLYSHNSVDGLVGVYLTYATMYLVDSEMGMEMGHFGCINGEA